MTCVHLKKLYQLCDQYQLKLSSSDLIRITCPECGLQETCPSVHLDEGRPQSWPPAASADLPADHTHDDQPSGS